MPTYVVEAPHIELPAGTLVGLEDEVSIQRRRNLVDPVADRPGVYCLRVPLHFKRGETIGLDEVGKGMAPALARVGGEDHPPLAPAAEAAEAKPRRRR